MTFTVTTEDGARLCVETFGTRAAPAIVLLAGATCSMDWWDDELCRRLADAGRLVVRFDARDTGRSTSYPPGAPGYVAADLGHDVLAIQDALGVERAHLAGLSMGGGIAQALAFEHPDRVATLTLMSTSPIEPGHDLPGLAPELAAAWAKASEPDWSDRDAVVTHIVEGERLVAGPDAFDEPRTRSLAERVVDRSNDVAASFTNHPLVQSDPPPHGRLADLAQIPTLVLHGSVDPMFPPRHGEALAEAIPGARLILLEGVGHQVPPRRLWDRWVALLTEHTNRGQDAGR